MFMLTFDNEIITTNLQSAEFFHQLKQIKNFDDLMNIKDHKPFDVKLFKQLWHITRINRVDSILKYGLMTSVMLEPENIYYKTSSRFHENYFFTNRYASSQTAKFLSCIDYMPYAILKIDTQGITDYLFTDIVGFYFYDGESRLSGLPIYVYTKQQLIKPDYITHIGNFEFSNFIKYYSKMASLNTLLSKKKSTTNCLLFGDHSETVKYLWSNTEREIKS